MGLYNMLFPQDESAGTLLAAISLTAGDIGRYRNCYLTPDGEIAIYTRMGGGNRECYCSEGEAHYCYQADIAALQAHPAYLRDEDDDFDRTYATFYFRVPESLPEGVTPRETTPNQDWTTLIGALRERQP